MPTRFLTRDGAVSPLVGLLVKCAAVLTVLSAVGQVLKHTLVNRAPLRWEWLGHPIRFFDLNRERNLPTWYQGLALLLCAVLLWGIAGARARAGASGVRHWRGLAVIFVYLSCDELFKWHERTVEPLRAWLNLTDGFLLYTWVVPAVVLVALVAALYARFFFRLPPDARRLFACAAALYVGGALGMEIVGGKLHTELGYAAPISVAA